MAKGRRYKSIGINIRTGICEHCNKSYKGSVKSATKLIQMHVKLMHPELSHIKIKVNKYDKICVETGKYI